MPRCPICFGEHTAKQHKKTPLAKDGEITIRCPGCMRYVNLKILKMHKRWGCSNVVEVPPAANLRGSDDNQLQQPD